MDVNKNEAIEMEVQVQKCEKAHGRLAQDWSLVGKQVKKLCSWQLTLIQN